MGVYELSGAGSLKTGRVLYPTMNANNGNNYGAMVPIGSAEASGSSNSLSFSSIPSTYQALTIVLNARSTNASTTTQAIMFFNGDVSSSSYSATWLDGDGSSATSGRQSNFSQLYCVDGMPAASADIIGGLAIAGVLILSGIGVTHLTLDYRYFNDIKKQCESVGYIQDYTTRINCSIDKGRS